jgi:hypothetical protein
MKFFISYSAAEKKPAAPLSLKAPSGARARASSFNVPDALATCLNRVSIALSKNLLCAIGRDKLLVVERRIIRLEAASQQAALFVTPSAAFQLPEIPL